MDGIKGTVVPLVCSLLLLLFLNVAACSGSDSSSMPSNSPNSPNSPSSPVSVVQEAYVKASNAERPDLFGTQVALSGNTLAVGAWHESSCATGVNGDQSNNGCEFSGAVYVFVRNGNGGWTQQAYLKPSNTVFQHKFGIALALSGDTLAVGAPDDRTCATGINGNPQLMGCNSSGAVYVFTRTGEVWTQQAYVKPSHTDPNVMGGYFGTSVALSGDTLAVGAQFEASCASGINGDQTNTACPNAGAAYIFMRSSNVWSQQAYLKAPNTNAQDYFGYSIALSGDTVAVGALQEASCATGVNGDAGNNGCPSAGAVYLFRRASEGWVSDAYLKASNTESLDHFGSAVAMSGATLAVAAMTEGSCTRQINGDQQNNDCTNYTNPGAVYFGGAVYVFTRQASGWVQQAYVKPSNMDPGDTFGAALALSGDMLAVGASTEQSCATGVNGDQSNNDCGNAPVTGSSIGAGAVYLFTRSSDVWTQQAYVKASNTGLDNFATSVALADQLLAVGATGESSCARGINGDQQDNSCEAAGAVYVYRTGP
jgi:FG-GAP repeat